MRITNPQEAQRRAGSIKTKADFNSFVADLPEEQLPALASQWALDLLSIQRIWKLGNLGDMLDMASMRQKDRATGQSSIFDGL